MTSGFGPPQLDQVHEWVCVGDRKRTCQHSPASRVSEKSRHCTGLFPALGAGGVMGAACCWCSRGSYWKKYSCYCVDNKAMEREGTAVSLGVTMAWLGPIISPGGHSFQAMLPDTDHRRVQQMHQ